MSSIRSQLLGLLYYSIVASFAFAFVFVLLLPFHLLFSQVAKDVWRFQCTKVQTRYPTIRLISRASAQF